jgi:hypothetical protein
MKKTIREKTFRTLEQLNTERELCLKNSSVFQGAPGCLHRGQATLIRGLGAGKRRYRNVQMALGMQRRGLKVAFVICWDQDTDLITDELLGQSDLEDFSCLAPLSAQSRQKLQDSKIDFYSLDHNTRKDKPASFEELLLQITEKKCYDAILVDSLSWASENWVRVLSTIYTLVKNSEENNNKFFFVCGADITKSDPSNATRGIITSINACSSDSNTYGWYVLHKATEYKNTFYTLPLRM